MAVRRLAAALLLGLSLAACADEPQDPSALPTLSADASTGASPSASPEPTGIDAPTPEGAGAFARHWFAELNRAAASGDTRLLRDLSGDECETCRLYADSVDELYQPGGRIEGGVFSLSAAEAPAMPEGATEARVTVVFDVTPTRQIAADGSTLREVPALQAVAGEMTLRRTSDGWLASRLDIE